MDAKPLPIHIRNVWRLCWIIRLRDYFSGGFLGLPMRPGLAILRGRPFGIWRNGRRRKMPFHKVMLRRYSEIALSQTGCGGLHRAFRDNGKKYCPHAGNCRLPLHHGRTPYRYTLPTGNQKDGGGGL